MEEGRVEANVHLPRDHTGGNPLTHKSEKRSNSYFAAASSCATWRPSTTGRTRQRPQLGLQLKQLHGLLTGLKLQLHELLMELLGLLSRSRGFSLAHKPNLLVCLSPRLLFTLRPNFPPASPFQLFQAGSPFPFPPFLFPPATSLSEASLKDSAAFPAAFLQGLRPPGLHPASLLDPAQAQALLTMMRAQVPPGARLSAPPGIPLPSPAQPPAKKQRRSSSSVDEPPVSPPASRPTGLVPPSATSSSSCLSLCATSAACSAEGRALLAMDTDQVPPPPLSIP